MERALQVGHHWPFLESTFSIHHNQAFITSALISILTRSHQQPPPANHQLFGRIRMRHHRHLRQSPYLAHTKRMHTALRLSEHAPLRGWLP